MGSPCPVPSHHPPADHKGHRLRQSRGMRIPNPPSLSISKRGSNPAGLPPLPPTSTFRPEDPIQQNPAIKTPNSCPLPTARLEQEPRPPPVCGEAAALPPPPAPRKPRRARCGGVVPGRTAPRPAAPPAGPRWERGGPRPGGLVQPCPPRPPPQSPSTTPPAAAAASSPPAPGARSAAVRERQ